LLDKPLHEIAIVKIFIRAVPRKPE